MRKASARSTTGLSTNCTVTRRGLFVDRHGWMRAAFILKKAQGGSPQEGNCNADHKLKRKQGQFLPKGGGSKV
jgi:hypothetical protein